MAILALMSLLSLLIGFSTESSSKYHSVHCIKSERASLLEFKHGFDASNRFASWTVKEDCCRWKGVTCNHSTGHVSAINLRAQHFTDYLQGKIRDSLLDLPYLTHLDLSRNHLKREQIPEFIGSLKNLEYLILFDTNLRGRIPHQLGNLSKLQFLDLSGNELAGSIPDAFGKLTSLQTLNLSNNLLTGQIPSSIGHLIHLRELRIDSNLISGEIPSSLNKLTNLHVLDININQVSGKIPPWIGESFPNLTILRLANNELSGEIPVQIRSLVGLVILDLSHNNLTGTISSGIGAIASLEWLDLSWNELSCSIPKGIANLTSLSHLDLSHNNLSGKIPSLWNWSLPQIVALRGALVENGELCGYPLFKACSEAILDDPHCKLPHKDHSEYTSFYIGVGVGLVTAVWVYWIVYLVKPWREAYSRFLDRLVQLVCAFVQVNGARLIVRS